MTDEEKIEFEFFNMKQLRESGKLPEHVAVSHQQAPGAIPNGTRVQKCNTEPRDDHQDGALATVLGSVGPVNGMYGYFVEWDDWPGIPVFIRGNRILE
jgi:hypothetical protein